MENDDLTDLIVLISLHKGFGPSYNKDNVWNGLHYPSTLEEQRLCKHGMRNLRDIPYPTSPAELLPMDINAWASPFRNFAL